MNQGRDSNSLTIIDETLLNPTTHSLTHARHRSESGAKLMQRAPKNGARCEQDREPASKLQPVGTESAERKIAVGQTTSSSPGSESMEALKWRQTPDETHMRNEMLRKTIRQHESRCGNQQAASRISRAEYLQHWACREPKWHLLDDPTTLNPKSQTRNPKPQTLNPRP